MNLELQHSFGQSYPEEYDGTLDCVSVALTCSFNRRGTLLAVGCNDGRIVIWDFLTRGIAKIINAHVHQVCSLCWSRNGKKLLSASTDFTVAVWDVLSGDCDQKYRFPSPVSKVQFHPKNNNLFLVCPMKQGPVIVDIKKGHKILPVGGDNPQNMVASFDRNGNYVYTGNAKGKIMVINTGTLQVVTQFKISTGTSANTAIKSIEFSRRGSALLVNSQDRIIRVFDSEIVLSCKDHEEAEPEPIQKLQDLVNRTLWKKCCFSGDGEYIVAGSSRQHSLYIWEKGVGNLVKILHGTKGEMLLDVVWHPVRPIIASVSSGVVSIWAQNHVENWSAFAPDFKELDENVEYDERESEFDIDDEDKEEVVHSGSEAGEDTEVDVVTIDRKVSSASLCDEPFSSDDEDNPDALYYLPVAPEIDDPEETPQPGEDNYGLDKDNKRPVHQDTPLESPKKKTKIIDINFDGQDQVSGHTKATRPSTVKSDKIKPRKSGGNFRKLSKSSDEPPTKLIEKNSLGAADSAKALSVKPDLSRHENRGLEC